MPDMLKEVRHSHPGKTLHYGFPTGRDDWGAYKAILAPRGGK